MTRSKRSVLDWPREWSNAVWLKTPPDDSILKWTPFRAVRRSFCPAVKCPLMEWESAGAEVLKCAVRTKLSTIFP